MVDAEDVVLSRDRDFATYQAFPPGGGMAIHIDVFRDGLMHHLRTDTLSDEAFVTWVEQNRAEVERRVWAKLMPTDRSITIGTGDW